MSTSARDLLVKSCTVFFWMTPKGFSKFVVEGVGVCLKFRFIVLRELFRHSVFR